MRPTVVLPDPETPMRMMITATTEPQIGADEHGPARRVDGHLEGAAASAPGAARLGGNCLFVELLSCLFPPPAPINKSTTQQINKFSKGVVSPKTVRATSGTRRD